MKKLNSKSGFSMAASLACMAIVSVLITVMVKSSQQRSYTTALKTQQLKAEAYAEAGFEHAKAMLEGNDGWANRSNPLNCIPSDLKSDTMEIEQTSGNYTISNVSYGDGYYSLTLKPTSNGQFCVVSAKGVCGDSEAEVCVLLEDFAYEESSDDSADPDDTTTELPAASAWDHTICAIGEMYLSGNGDINGSLHANQLLRLNGNVEIGPDAVDMTSSTQIKINGNVKAEGTFTAPTISVTGNKESGAGFSEDDVAAVAFPEYDLDELYETAVANGQVIAGNLKENKDLALSNIPGNVVWVTGYVKVTANAYIDCTIVAEGYINITGNCNWDEDYSSQNHIISKSDDIKIAGNTEVTGLIYTPGNVDISGNARISGQVIAGQDVTIHGNVDFCHFAYSGPTTSPDTVIPPLEPDNPHKVAIGISGWQK